MLGLTALSLVFIWCILVQDGTLWNIHCPEDRAEKGKLWPAGHIRPFEPFIPDRKAFRKSLSIKRAYLSFILLSPAVTSCSTDGAVSPIHCLSFSCQCWLVATPVQQRHQWCLVNAKSKWAKEKKNIDSECHVFNKEWIAKKKKKITKVRSKAVCLICQEAVAVFKE